MQSDHLSHPALNSRHNTWFMPKSNVFEYNKLVITTVLTTIATGEGLMCNKLSLEAEGFLGPGTWTDLGMLLNTVTI